MQHFVQIASQIDTLPLLLAIRQAPQIWGRSFRTTFPGSPHNQVLDAILRVQQPERSSDPRECYWQDLAARLPQARSLVMALMARLEGERLGRVLLTWLLPGCVIAPHRDIGPEGSGHYDTSAYWQRQHIVLSGDAGSTFTCGEEGDEETVVMEPQTVWWFNSALRHSCTNNGKEDRIHLIADIHKE